MALNANSTQDDSENFYQISDDDIDDCEELGDDSLLEEIEGRVIGASGRGPYERAWTTDATRALIHIRGPMEGRFTEGRQKRTALWLHCTRQLQKLGYRYSAAKVQKKWHNILITYNKNLSKKYLTGHVHWEFFEEMYKYLQGKKANPEAGSISIEQYSTHQHQEHHPDQQPQQQHQPQASDYQISNNSDHDLVLPQLQMDQKKPKLELDPLPAEISHFSGCGPIPAINSKNTNELNISDVPGKEELFQEHGNEERLPWWKDYFERKLQMERDKIQLQKEIHRDLLQLHKISLSQQERIERTKIEAINNLANGLQKLAETKSRRT